MQVIEGGFTDVLLFLRSHCLSRVSEAQVFAVLDFRKNNDPFLAGDDVDLALPCPEIPLKDPDTLFFKETDSLVLSEPSRIPG